jgi:hypothetical protein
MPRVAAHTAKQNGNGPRQQSPGGWAVFAVARMGELMSSPTPQREQSTTGKQSKGRPRRRGMDRR